MSATGRSLRGGDGRDFFPTPYWATRLVYNEVRQRTGYGRARSAWRILEPCAGSGAIVDSLLDFDRELSHSNFTLTDIAGDGVLNPLRAKYPGANVMLADAARINMIGHPVENKYDLIITNPPFNTAIEILRGLIEGQLLRGGGVAAFLLRLNFLEGTDARTNGRHSFLREHKPDVCVLPNRPGFQARFGATDACAYAWFLFPGKGQYKILSEVPAVVRRADHRELWGGLR